MAAPHKYKEMGLPNGVSWNLSLVNLFLQVAHFLLTLSHPGMPVKILRCNARLEHKWVRP
jgi:hypothetical protein